MKISNSKYRFLCLGLALSAWIFSACAEKKQVLLPGGLRPGSGYMSPEQMAALEKNSFGVPESSFGFYPKNYAPLAKNEAGRTLEQQQAYEKALMAAGRNISVSTRLRPGNAPFWDKSYADPDSLAHDCFSTERLFVVPWGSGDGQIGLKKGDTSQTMHQPVIAYRQAGEILIYDIPNLRVLHFDFGGKLLATDENVKNIPDTDWEIYDDQNYSKVEGKINFLGLEEMGRYGRVFDDGSYITIYYDDHNLQGYTLNLINVNIQKVLCKIYMPPSADQDVIARIAAANFGGVILDTQPTVFPQGFVIYPRLTKNGLEILRYIRK